MDKLRALRYLEAAARGHSLSAAARHFEVSAAAVAKLVGALEDELGVRLVERGPRGLRLTAAGADYLDACIPALRRLDSAENDARATTVRPKGRIVVGIQHVIARGCLAEALPRFHARYPEVELDIRDVQLVPDQQRDGLDVMLVLGWPSKIESLIHRVIASSHFLVAASPSYWLAHEIPRRPSDLHAHVCLPIRAIAGGVMRRWEFRRGGEVDHVDVSSWLTTSNAHRDIVIDLALTGHGVVRLLEWTNRPELASGRLVRVLDDWESTDAIPVNLLYPPSARRLLRVRTFIDFAVEVFAAFELPSSPVSAQPPDWLHRRYASHVGTTGRK